MKILRMRLYGVPPEAGKPETRAMKTYEQIPHTADIALRIYGKDLAGLFANAAFGMFDVIADLEGLKTPLTIDINVEAPSREELLISWLDELLYTFYTKGIIFRTFDIAFCDGKKLVAKACGRNVSDNRNRLKTEIKAATFHDLEIKETKEGLTVDIVFDV
jgi:SHS2 domain-containing protein